MTLRGRLVETTAALQRLHHWTYTVGLRPVRRASVPTISVGGLTVGGAGKTPFTRWVTEHLLSRGVRVGVVSRGYGRFSRGPVLVSEGRGPIIPVRQAGDEPWMLAASTSAVVAVAEERVRGAELAVARGAEVLILDDGFQHRRLHRDLDIVLIDAVRSPPLVLPFGPAREPPSALRRADLVVAYDPSESGLRCPQASARVEVQVEAWRHLRGSPAVPPRRAYLVSGIARPDRFRRFVEHLGVSVCGHRRFADHHWFDDRDARRTMTAAARSGADALVLTAKDAVRWPSHVEAPPVPVIELRIKLVVVDGRDRLDQALDRLLC